MTSIPLTLFERYLLHEDRPAYPCWILTRFRFAGGFRREALQRAWEQTVPRHPLLSRIVAREGLGRLVWRSAPEFQPAVRWVAALAPSGWPEWTPTDLTVTPGVQLIAHEAGGRSDLFFHAHHALHDGAGHFAVIEDLLVHYARELGGDTPLATYDAERFRGRNRFGLSFGRKLRLVPMQLLGLAASAQLSLRTPCALAPERPTARAGDKATPAWPALASRTLPPDDSEWLGHAARLLQTGLHHLLIRDTHAAIGAWLSSRPYAQPLDWVYLLVPVNLRRPADLRLPAANLVGLVIMARQLKSLARRERLLQRVNEDMGWIKRGRFGYVFLVMLWLRSLLPGGIRRFARSTARRSTMLLTNLGDVYAMSPLRNADGRVAVPGAVLEALHVAPPCRPGTQAGLAVGFYAGRFWADLQYDPAALSREDGEALLDAFMAQLRLSSEEVG